MGAALEGVRMVRWGVRGCLALGDGHHAQAVGRADLDHGVDANGLSTQPPGAADGGQQCQRQHRQEGGPGPSAKLVANEAHR